MPTTKVVKVPLLIDDKDKDIQSLKYRALNRVMSEARYLGNMAIRYAIAYRLKEIQKLVSDRSDEPVPPPGTRIYRILAKERQFLPADNAGMLGRNFAEKAVKNADKDAWAGRKSLPTYRSQFLPIRGRDTAISAIKNEGKDQFLIMPGGFKSDKWLTDELISEVNEGNPVVIPKGQKALRLRSNFSYKDSGSIEIVKRIAAKEYKLSDSQLQNRDGKIMAFLSYQFEPEKPALDIETVCGVDLGVVIPVVCAKSSGPQRMYIGDGKDIQAVRNKFRNQRRRGNRRKGLYTKTRRWQQSKKENNWIQTYYHAATRQVIKFCLQHGCGTIHVENLTQLRTKELQEEKSEYKRLMWVPSKFNELLAYKAEELGIQIVKVNPRNTSRRCHRCGHISKDNRKSQSKFICEKCGDGSKPINADYNAAKNIALASGEVIKEGYKIEKTV